GPSPADMKPIRPTKPASAHDIEVAAAEARAAQLKKDQEEAVKAAQQREQAAPRVPTPAEVMPKARMPRPGQIGPRPGPRPTPGPTSGGSAAGGPRPGPRPGPRAGGNNPFGITPGGSSQRP